MSSHSKLGYRPKEISEETGLSKAQVYKLIAAGQLKAVRVGRALLVARAELERLCAEGINDDGEERG